jgi:uncharacterized protein GlcG (DUF336 family)
VSSSEEREPVSAASIRAELGEMPWRAARGMVDHVLSEAERRGLRVVVSLTDRWGRQLAFQRQPGTVTASSAVAIGKALAACTFDAPTHVLVETISRRDQEELGRVNHGIVFAGGGFPIRVGGLLVGGIGVSGASVLEDAELALGALEREGFDVKFGEPAGEDG